MPDLTWTTTTSVMLDALREPENQTAWSEFDARYQILIRRFAQRLGLSPEDAADVAQTTLAQFVRDYRAGKYDRGKGRLSAWIIGIARHRAIDLQRARGRRREFRGTSALLDLADEQQLTQLWESEQRQAIFAQALIELRNNSKTSDNTMRVFDLFARDGLPAETVAQHGGVSVAEVYRIKNRVTKRLRQIVDQLTRAYLEDE